MAIRALVWGENVHEQKNAVVRKIYPDGMHSAIAGALKKDPNIQASTATLQDPEHGLTEDRLAKTDVLLWWGHAGHGPGVEPGGGRGAAPVWGGVGRIV